MKFDVVKYIDGRVQRFAFAKPLVTRKPFTFSQSPQAIPGMIGQDKVFDGAELMVSEITGKTVKSFNLWDEEWELGSINTATGLPTETSIAIRGKNYIEILPNTTYYKAVLSNKEVAPFLYDADLNFIGVSSWGYNNTFTTPSNAKYFRMWMSPAYGTTYNHDICINVSQPNTSVSPHNGEYLPYFDGLKSVEVSGVQVNGANLYNRESRFDGNIIFDGVLNNNPSFCASAYIKCKGFDYVSINYAQSYGFYDENYNVVAFENKSITMARQYAVPRNATYFRFDYNKSTYDGDIMCVAGNVLSPAYKPYRAPWLFDLGQTVTLNGVGSAGDKISIVAKENGLFDVVKTTAMGSVDLGTLDYTKRETASYRGFTANAAPTGYKINGMNMICTKFSPEFYSATLTSDNIMSPVFGTTILFYSSDTFGGTESAFKSAMSGVYLIYELSTPTTVTLLSDLTRDEITALVETYGSIEIVGNDNQQFVQPTVTVNIDAQSQTEIQKFSVDIPKPADPVFANNDWPTILSNFKKGTAPATWQVGDTKPLTLTDGRTYTIRLCDKQEGRYDYSDGSGSSKAVFEFVELVKVGSTTTFQMNTSHKNAGGWANCYMRGTNIPNIEALLPDDVLAAISEVNVLSSTGDGTTSGTSSSANKLFLPAEMEMFSSKTYSIGIEECPLGQFDYYKVHDTNAGRIKRNVGTTTANHYWLRSPQRGNPLEFGAIYKTGAISTFPAASLCGVSPIFAV